MRTVVTKWAYIDYRCDLSSDYSGLFSEEVGRLADCLCQFMP